MKILFLVGLLCTTLTGCSREFIHDYLEAQAMDSSPAYRLEVMNRDVMNKAYQRCISYGLSGPELAQCTDYHADKMRQMNAQAVGATRNNTVNCSSYVDFAGQLQTTCR